MALKPCITCGTLTTATRCPTCNSSYDRQRRARRGNRYGGEHQQLRRQWETILATGATVSCARCGLPVVGAFDLDHMPDGTSRPSHPSCNRAAHR